MSLPALKPAQELWVEQLFARLTPAEKIGQLLHPFITVDAPELEARLQSALDAHVGAVFQGGGRTSDQLRELFARLDAKLTVPLLMSGDYECGPAIAGMPGIGSTMAVAAIGDLDSAARVAHEIGRSSALIGRAVGTRWTLAPVVDLSLNPDNPIVNTRSYGDDPDRVIAIASAFVRGAQENGMAATVKHFPGDGVDARDQHLVTTVNTMPLPEWRAKFGRIYRELFAAGVWSCMTGHIALAGLSSRHPKTGRLLPATLDERIQRGLLRDELGFEGVIVSDAIRMGGIVGHVLDGGERTVANLAAGADVVLFPDDLGQSVQAITRALGSGRLDWSRLEASVRRVLAMKARAGLDIARGVPAPAELPRLLDPVQLSTVSASLAERCLTKVRDEDGTLPLRLRAGSKIVIFELPREPNTARSLVIAGQDDAIRPKTALQNAFESRGHHAISVHTLPDFHREITDADALLYLFLTGPQAGRGSVRLSYNAQQYIELTRAARTIPVVYCGLGSPYVPWELSMLPNFVATYSPADATQTVLVAALLGEIPFAGRLPVRLPEAV